MMNRKPFVQSVVVYFLAFAAFTAAAHAQLHPATAARCTNAAINQAFTAMTMVPNGSGNSGECDPSRYEGGMWSTQQNLQQVIVHSRDCSSSPYIGQVYIVIYKRSPTAAECNLSTYGVNSLSSFGDAQIKVQAYMSKPAAPALAANQYLVNTSGALVDYHGTVVATPGSYVLANDGATLVGNAGGTIFPQPGMVISNDGGSLASQRSIMSSGKRVIKGTIVKR